MKNTNSFIPYAKLLVSCHLKWVNALSQTFQSTVHALLTNEHMMRIGSTENVAQDAVVIS